MATKRKPILLNETGKEIINAINNVANAIGQSEDYSLEQMATGIVLEESSNPAWTRMGNKVAIDRVINKYGAIVIDPERKVYARLSDNDLNTFADGTPWDGVTGDAFRHFGDLHYLVKHDENGKQCLWGSDHHIAGGHTLHENFVGCYKGHIDASGHLRSIPNARCMGGLTMSEYWNRAQRRGAEYGLMNYHDHQKMMAMHLLHFGTANSEQTMGKGLQDAGGSPNDPDGHCYYQPTTGFCAALGIHTGEAQYKTSAYKMNSLFGVEGLVGAQWEFRPNIRFTADKCIVYEGNIVSNDAAGREFDRVLLSGQYIKGMQLGEHFDMMPLTGGAGATTYWCDYCWAQASGQLLLVGGPSYYGSYCGLGFSYSHSGFSASAADFGARLAFKGDLSELTEVSGANFSA